MIQKGRSLLRVFIGWLGASNIDLHVDAIWRSKAPTKACFLAWAAIKEKVPTQDMLKRRNFNLASRCPMCRQEEETLTTFLFIIRVSPGFGIYHLLIRGRLVATSYY